MQNKEFSCLYDSIFILIILIKYILNITSMARRMFYSYIPPASPLIPPGQVVALRRLKDGKKCFPVVELQGLTSAYF